MISNFVQQRNFMKSSGFNRQRLEEEAIRSEIEMGFAHLLEVCLESSFQPLLQWYLIFPDVMHMESNIELLSFCSWFASVLSLAWSFTNYKAALKMGAISIQTNCLGRILLFLSNLLLIFPRMNCIVLFMYWWGPGQFYPGIIAILVHAFLMGVLHIVFSCNSAKSTKDHTKTKLTCSLHIHSFWKLV